MEGSAAVLWVLTPVIGLAVNCCVHVVLARACGPARPYRDIVRAGLVGLVVVVVMNVRLAMVGAMNPVDAIASTLLHAATYAALAFDYFSFVNLGLTSLRIRMLQELQGAGGALPVRSLQALYDDDAMVAVRLQRLIDGGHLVVRGERLYAGRGVFLTIARVFAGLRWFILGGRRDVRGG